MKLPKLNAKLNTNNINNNSKQQDDILDFEQQINRINDCK